VEKVEENGYRKGGVSVDKVDENGCRKGEKLLKIYTKSFGGKIFSATRVVFSSKNSQLAPRKLLLA
jgi:nucleoside-triphosphatase THEP1